MIHIVGVGSNPTAVKFFFYFQDASEFLTALLQQLDDETKQPETIPKDCIKISASNALHGSPCKQRKTSPKNEIKEKISPISASFNGKLTSTVKCLFCQTKSETFETFQTLSMSIPNNPVSTPDQKEKVVNPTDLPKPENKFSMKDFFSISIFYFIISMILMPLKSAKNYLISRPIHLKDCLANFTEKDVLRNENMYSCSKCKKLRNGERYYSLKSTPNVFIFHLKRFRSSDFTGFSGSTSKINRHVDFDEDFEVNGYTYKLKSMVVHHGPTAAFGHYTAFVTSDGEQWY